MIQSNKSQRRQTIAPRYHAKGKVLDAIGVTLLMIFMAVFGCAVLLLSVGNAKADTDHTVYAYASTYGSAVCGTLDKYPGSLNAVLGIAAAIVDDGLTAFQAGEVIQISVNELCPEHLGTLQRFVAKYGSSSAAA